jgi:hypothetical protein
VLGKSVLEKLDAAFETSSKQQEFNNVTTNTGSAIETQSGSTPTEVSETDTTGAATIPTVPTTNAGSQNGKGDLGNSAGVSTKTTEQVVDGKVTILQGMTPELREQERNKPFLGKAGEFVNLIKAFFNQSTVNSPLVLVKDYTNVKTL